MRRATLVELVAAVIVAALLAAYPLALSRWGADSRHGLGDMATDERLRRHRPDAWW